MGSIFFDVLRRLSESQLNEITIDQERCIDIGRKEKRLCTACQENCVADAIKIWERVDIDWNKCVRCGVCAAVCPTEVFTMQVLSDNMVLKEITAQSEKEPVLVECNFVNKRFEGKEKHSQAKGKKIIVPCLARFSETFLLQSSLAAGNHLEFAKCTSDCSFKTGRKVIEEMGQRSNLLLERFQAASKKNNKPYEKKISERRILLGEAGLQAINMVLPRNTPNAKQSSSKDKIPLHRAGLIEIVKAQTPEGQFIRGKMPFGNVTVDTEKCRLHGRCAEACPTGALRIVDNNQGKELVFLYGACVGCRACLEACSEGALKLEENIDLARLAAPWITLMSKQYQLCTSCGRQFSVRMGANSQVCPSCEERWAEIEKYASEAGA